MQFKNQNPTVFFVSKIFDFAIQRDNHIIELAKKPNRMLNATHFMEPSDFCDLIRMTHTQHTFSTSHNYFWLFQIDHI